MSTNWGKVSVALFLLRMVDRAKQQRHYFYFGIVLLTLINSASVGIIYGQCEHPSDIWAKPEERKGACWDSSIHTNVAFAQSCMCTCRRGLTFSSEADFASIFCILRFSACRISGHNHLEFEHGASYKTNHYLRDDARYLVSTPVYSRGMTEAYQSTEPWSQPSSKLYTSPS